MFTTSEILDKAIDYKGFKVAHPVHEAILSLISPLLASGKVKKKHENRILEVADRFPTELAEELAQKFGNRFSKDIMASLQKRAFTSLEYLRSRLMLKIFFREIIRNPMDFLSNFLLFITDILWLRIHPPGCLVMLWHPDKQKLDHIISRVYEKTRYMLLGEHRFISRKRLILSNKLFEHDNYFFAWLDTVIGYFFLLRKSIRRHGIILLSTDINKFIPQKKMFFLSLILRRLSIIDLNSLDSMNQNISKIAISHNKLLISNIIQRIINFIKKDNYFIN